MNEQKMHSIRDYKFQYHSYPVNLFLNYNEKYGGLAINKFLGYNFNITNYIPGPHTIAGFLDLLNVESMTDVMNSTDSIIACNAKNVKYVPAGSADLVFWDITEKEFSIVDIIHTLDTLKGNKYLFQMNDDDRIISESIAYYMVTYLNWKHEGCVVIQDKIFWLFTNHGNVGFKHYREYYPDVWKQLGRDSWNPVTDDQRAVQRICDAYGTTSFTKENKYFKANEYATYSLCKLGCNNENYIPFCQDEFTVVHPTDLNRILVQ